MSARFRIARHAARVIALLFAAALGACAPVATPEFARAPSHADPRYAQAQPAAAKRVLWTAPFPALGLTLRDLAHEELAQRRVPYGVLVESVSGDAEFAGLLPGDVIVAVNDTAAPTLQRFWELVETAGPRIAVFAMRDGALVKFELDNLAV